MSEYEGKYDRRLLARCRELEAQLAEAREAIRTLLNTDSQSAWELILGETTLIKINVLASGENESMKPDTLKELIASLAWYDASAHHASNVRRILETEYPGVDFAETLKWFLHNRTMPPGEGCPR